MLENTKETEQTLKYYFNGIFLGYFLVGMKYLKKIDNERAYYYLSLAYRLYTSVDDLGISEYLVIECNATCEMLKDKSLVFNENFNNLINSFLTVEQQELWKITKSYLLSSPNQLIYEEFLHTIQTKAEDMTYEQLIIWNWLTLCRLKTFFQLLENQEDCEIFKQIPEIIKNILAMLMDEASNEQLEECKEYLSQLDYFNKLETYRSLKISDLCDEKMLQIDVSVTDTADNLREFLDQIIHNYQLPTYKYCFGPGFVCAAFRILQSYYIRITDDPIDDVPQIKNEMIRIWKDYDLLTNDPYGDDIIDQMEIYMQMDIFQE